MWKPNPKYKPRKEVKLKKSDRAFSAEKYPTSPVIDKKFVDTGKGIVEEDVTETLEFLMNPIEDQETTAKTGPTEEEDLTKAYNHPTTTNGSIISDSNDLLHYPLYVYSSTLCTRWDRIKEYIDVEFNELRESVIEADGLPEIYESWGQDGYEVGNGKIRFNNESDIAQQLGEEWIVTIPANHHLQIKLKAINTFETDDYDEPTENGLAFEWLFSSGEDNYEVNVLDKVQNLGSILDIPNIQRENIGRYTCHVKNKWGEVKSKTIYVHVERPGELQEEMREIEGVEFRTGTTIFVENLNDMHDEKYTIYDDKVVWDNTRDEFVEVYWDTNKESWEEERSFQSKDPSDRWVYSDYSPKKKKQ